MFSKVGSSVQCRDGSDRLGKGEDDATIDETGYVGNEDLLEDIPTGVAERIKDATGLVLTSLVSNWNRF